MIKSIVSALDGSEASLAGLKQAAFLAKQLKAELRGVFVEAEAPFTFFPSYSESKGERAKRLADEHMMHAQNPSRIEEEDLRGHFKKIVSALEIPAVLHILKGRVNETLVREAHGAGLMVLGNRGRKGGPATESPGSTTEIVIHETQRPVLVVPPEGDLQGPVLMAFDGSRGVQRVLMAGVELALALSAPMTVLTIKDHRTDGDRVQETLRHYLEPYRLKVEYIIEPGEKRADAMILERAQAMDAGMLMMGAYNLTPIREFFFGGVTRSVLAQTLCPVLIMS